jgi:VIT1/CCC1 family predicted Fe2+/Mn2+ transporter
MIPQYDIEYSLVREAEERLASKNAADETARMAHAELADLYAERAWSAREARCEDSLKC